MICAFAINDKEVLWVNLHENVEKTLKEDIIMAFPW